MQARESADISSSASVGIDAADEAWNPGAEQLSSLSAQESKLLSGAREASAASWQPRSAELLDGVEFKLDAAKQLKVFCQRLDSELTQRFGQPSIENLKKRGIDLRALGREHFVRLHQQFVQHFRLEVGPIGLALELQHHFASDHQRPSTVENGYLLLNVTEKQVWRLFIKQAEVYQHCLDYILGDLARYMERLFYFVEKQWLIFQDSYNREQKEAQLGKHEDLARSLFLRNQSLEELNSLAHSFWSDYFQKAMEQVFLELELPKPGQQKRGLRQLEQLERFPFMELEQANEQCEEEGKKSGFELLHEWRQRNLSPDPHCVALLSDLEKHFDRGACREALQEMAGRLVEKSLETQYLQLQHRYSEGDEKFYWEYSREEMERPDESIDLSFCYRGKENLERECRRFEAELAQYSEKIQGFFSEIERQTRLFKMMQPLDVMRRRWRKNHEQAISLEKNLAIQELLAKKSREQGQQLALSSQHKIESKLLLELLHKANTALEDQIHILPTRRFVLLQQMLKKLQQEFLDFLQRPMYSEQEAGLSICAVYRTVKARKESLSRVQALMADLQFALESPRSGVAQVVQQSTRITPSSYYQQP